VRFFIAFTFLLFSRCRYEEVKSEAPRINELVAGSKFSIILPEEHAKGETWNVYVSNSRILEEINAVWHGEKVGIEFFFRTLQTDFAGGNGLCSLIFVRRSFSDTSGRRTYIVKVRD
jgi:hypothetical protein